MAKSVADAVYDDNECGSLYTHTHTTTGEYPRTHIPPMDSNFAVSHFDVDYSNEYTKPGDLVGKSAGLVIERLGVQIPTGAAGEYSSSESTLRADSCSVSVLPPCYRSGT